MVTFSNKNWKVSKGSLVVAKFVKIDTLYLCIGHTIPSTLIISEKIEFLGTIVVLSKENK